jgi:hypothetical protein
MLTKCISRRKNSNIALSIKIGRNPKQYQNPNDQNSKQMWYSTVVLRFCHWGLCDLYLPFEVAQGGELVEPFRASIFEFRISMLLQNG